MLGGRIKTATKLGMAQRMVRTKTVKNFGYSISNNGFCHKDLTCFNVKGNLASVVLFQTKNLTQCYISNNVQRSDSLHGCFFVLFQTKDTLLCFKQLVTATAGADSVAGDSCSIYVKIK
jgi:hypothetical protein